MFLVKILSKQDYISIALLLYITNLYWYLLNIKQILETNVDPRSFLTQRHNKFSCIISQARVSNNIRFFRGVKKLSAPSWDSDVACQILTSSNLVLCKKTIIVPLHFLSFICSTFNKYVTRLFSNPIRPHTKEFRELKYSSLKRYSLMLN